MALNTNSISKILNSKSYFQAQQNIPEEEQARFLTEQYPAEYTLDATEGLFITAHRLVKLVLLLNVHHVVLNLGELWRQRLDELRGQGLPQIQTSVVGSNGKGEMGTRVGRDVD